MAAERKHQSVYALSGWEIDFGRRELRSKGVPVLLGSRACEFLAELVQSNGELLSRDELPRRVWRGVHVEDSALRVHMAAIRKASGADRELLNTSVGRGYRLLGEWAIRQTDVAASAPASDTMQVATIPRPVPVVAAE